MNWKTIRSWINGIFWTLFCLAFVGACVHGMVSPSGRCGEAESTINRLTPCYEDPECKLTSDQLNSLHRAERQAANVCPIARGEK